MKLTDAEIVRVFKLCDEIAAVKKELPGAPRGFDCSLEIAQALRTTLEQHAPALQELGTLLKEI